MIARAAFISLMMAAAALATAAIVPNTNSAAVRTPDLETLTPERIAGWSRLDVAAVVLPPETDLGPGEAVTYRAWRDAAGRVVTLVIAYGPPLGDSVRLHRPEACYRAQGYVIQERREGSLSTDGDDIALVHLDANKALRREAVTYWMRDGDAYVRNARGHEMLFFRRGLAAPTDAALVRVSSAGEGASAHELHRIFLTDFVNALSPEGRAVFLADAS